MMPHEGSVPTLAQDPAAPETGGARPPRGASRRPFLGTTTVRAAGDSATGPPSGILVALLSVRALRVAPTVAPGGFA